MGDFKLVHLAGRALGVYEKFVVLAIKAAGDTTKLYGHIVKITQHGLNTGNLHGAVVVGILPHVVFGLVAIHAFFAPDKSSGL